MAPNVRATGGLSIPRWDPIVRYGSSRERQLGRCPIVDVTDVIYVGRHQVTLGAGYGSIIRTALEMDLMCADTQGSSAGIAGQIRRRGWRRAASVAAVASQGNVNCAIDVFLRRREILVLVDDGAVAPGAVSDLRMTLG